MVMDSDNSLQEDISQRYSKCLCSSCGEPIEFPRGGVGETVDCPTVKSQLFSIFLGLQNPDMIQFQKLRLRKVPHLSKPPRNVHSAQKRF